MQDQTNNNETWADEINGDVGDIDSGALYEMGSIYSKIYTKSVPNLLLQYTTKFEDRLWDILVKEGMEESADEIVRIAEASSRELLEDEEFVSSLMQHAKQCPILTSDEAHDINMRNAQKEINELRDTLRQQNLISTKLINDFRNMQDINEMLNDVRDLQGLHLNTVMQISTDLRNIPIPFVENKVKLLRFCEDCGNDIPAERHGNRKVCDDCFDDPQRASRQSQASRIKGRSLRKSRQMLNDEQNLMDELEESPQVYHSPLTKRGRNNEHN